METLSGSKIDEFCGKGQPIWIKNKTGAVLLISFSNGNQEVPLRVPPQQDPFCMSDYMTPDLIRNNPTLRRLISEGHIQLLDPEDPKLQKVKRTKALRGVVDASGTPEEQKEKQFTKRADAPVDLEPDVEDLNASPKVAYWVDAVEKGDMKEGDFLNNIAGIKDDLTEDDLSHIISILRGKEKIIEWATNSLAELREGSSEDDGPEVSSGTSEEIDDAAKELLARSKIQRSNVVESDTARGTRVEHNTMTKEERKDLKEKLSR